ncbi:hypothetical protein ACQEVB_02065 [Pseudonocardia sp. CA-107938]|uniref:hypothetical protein n=1 Tax=Pseudonocardia sp. CA-107938 TaxID=3240021 RepID=UPI003D925EBF
MRTLRIAPALAADTWHAGHDPSGLVRVELDGPGRGVRVTLAEGAPGPEDVGAAVVAAYSDAVVVRMSAWAMESSLPAPVPYDEPAAEQFATLRDAHRELAVFRRRLAELRAVPVTVETAGVAVTVRDGRPVDVRFTRVHADLADAIAAGLQAALTAVAEQPAAALARCPALRAVLGTSRLPLPFAL